MAIDIQRLLDHPAGYLSLALRRLAPRGWNTNTQFFLIFLAVLGAHLVAMPALMRSAGVREPGDPQGYLTSAPAHPSEDSSTEAPKPAPSEESLKISDAPIISEPLEEIPEIEIDPEDTPSDPAPSPSSPPMIAKPLEMTVDPAAELLVAIDAAEKAGQSAATKEPSLSDLVTEATPEEPGDPPAATGESPKTRSFRDLR